MYHKYLEGKIYTLTLCVLLGIWWSPSLENLALEFYTFIIMSFSQCASFYN